MSGWSDTARRVIQEVHLSLPETASLQERIKAVDDAYPFSIRKYWPYKAWLKARRDYLCRYGYQPKGKPLIESPLERMIRRGKQAAWQYPENKERP